MQAEHAFLVLCLSTTWLSTAGCTVFLSMPRETVTLRSTVEKQKVVVESQPSGATVTRDGAVVGTTPISLDLAYHSEERDQRIKYCWFVPLGGLVDLAAGGTGLWASYSELYKTGHRDLGIWSMIVSGLYGAIGLVGVLGPLIGGCTHGHPQSVAVHQDNPLRLTKDGWEEPYVVSAPLAPGQSTVSVVLRGLEQADWRRLDSLHTTDSYNEYLAKYPSGKWREQANLRLEELAWQSAREQDTVVVYRRYLAKYRPGKYRNEAELAIAKVFEISPDVVDEESLEGFLAGENPILRKLALVESVRRRRTQDVMTILSRESIAPTEREEVIHILQELAVGTRSEKALQEAVTAREILCRFGSEVFVSDSRSCDDSAHSAALTHCHAGEPSGVVLDGQGRFEGSTVSNDLGGSGDMDGCMRRYEAEVRASCTAKILKTERELRLSAARAGKCSTER